MGYSSAVLGAVNSAATTVWCPMSPMSQDKTCDVLAVNAQRPMTAFRAFTLIEMLVVIGVIALLLGLLLPALHTVRQSGEKVREFSAARQLMVAYTAYAYDHRGVLMPGYYFLDGQMLPAYDEAGNELTGPGPVAARYVWRLAPYLDYNLHGLYLDERVLEQLSSQELYHYLISVFPSMGINAVFVGGDTGYGLDDPQYEQLFGRFYLTRLSHARRPADLIVFASARINGETAQSVFGSTAPVEGFHRVYPPYRTSREWAERYDVNCGWPDCKAADFGFVSLRHHFREAAIGFFDGHTGTLDEGQIQDMRHWADQATRPDWVLEPQ